MQQESKDYVVVHSIDGYDEISLTGQVQYFSSAGELIFSPEDIGMKTVTPESLYGGNTLDEAANIFLDIINGNGTAEQNAAVIVNAGAAIHCFEQDKTLQECVAIAGESLYNGKAGLLLKKLIN